MKIAILSGKGGTGKTFVAVNLAVALGKSTYVDCDVEEPNGQLFFKPEIIEKKKVTIDLPAFDKEKCVGCRECVDFCRFNALVFIKDAPIVFPEICHPCGGCKIVCKYDAVSEEKKEVGEVLVGKSGETHFLSGIMNIGEASGVPVIKELLGSIPDNRNTVIDCPPGSGCMVMESIKDVDYCILVAEPTEFGRHNLEMVHQLVTVFEKPLGIVLNKCTEEENPSKDFCLENKIDIVAEIPFDKDLGRDNSNGEIVYYSNDKAKRIFNVLSGIVEKKVCQ